MKITKDMLKRASGDEFEDILSKVKDGKIKNIYQLCERIRKTKDWKHWEYEQTTK